MPHSRLSDPLQVSLHVCLSLLDRFIGLFYRIIQLIAHRVALNLEITFKTFSTNQNSAHGIYDEYQVFSDQSHENLGTLGTKSKVFTNNLEIQCHPICNRL